MTTGFVQTGYGTKVVDESQFIRDVRLSGTHSHRAAPASVRRTGVAATGFDHVTPGTPVRVSTGAVIASGMTGTDLFHAADANLYRANAPGTAASSPDSGPSGNSAPS